MPSQQEYPIRTVARTTFQLVVGIAAVLPLILHEAAIDTTVGIAASAVAISAVVTRVMALPQVEAFIAVYAPWLAAEPQSTGKHSDDAVL